MKEKLKKILIEKGIISNDIYSYSTPEELFDWYVKTNENVIYISINDLIDIIEKVQPKP